MFENMFRLLRADEIDARVAQVKENGLSLLLYKDARCDMNVLDETVGAFNWKREHSRENANCIVSIWDSEKQQWISKEDTGTESQSEAQKGLASDSFKRACVNWGIGRELYTAPFIWIKADDCKIIKSGDKFKSFDKFSVRNISYNDKREIDGLVIVKDYKEVFVWGKFKNNSSKSSASKKTEAVKISDMQYDSVVNALADMKRTEEAICAHYSIPSLRDMNTDQYTNLMKIYNDWRDKNAK